jgi:hypothetical protein
VRTKEVSCACIAAAVHMLLAAAAWRIPLDATRGNDAQHDEPPPLVAHFYDAGPASTQTSSVDASVATEQWATAIEAAPPRELDTIASDSAEAARETRSAEDYAEFERLQGMYRGQLFARLQRVLYELGPLEERTDVPCVLNVIQRTDGSVIDILTDLCDYSPQSLALLRKAVGAASPLPLPPPGLAVGTYLTLDVSAYLVTH